MSLGIRYLCLKKFYRIDPGEAALVRGFLFVRRFLCRVHQQEVNVAARSPARGTSGNFGDTW